MGLGCPLSGGACPGETDQRIRAPAVAEGLRGVAEAQPADCDQVFAGGFDAAQVHAKDLGNPGSFAPAAADAVTIAVVEAAEQVSQQSGDDRGTTAPSDEADDLPWHGHAPMVVGDRMIHGVEVREVVAPPQVGGRGGKRECGAGPDEQPGGFEAAERGAERLPPSPTDETVEFARCVCWDLARVDLASSSSHLLSGKPDPDIPQLDEPSTVGPPEKAELPDRQKHESPDRLAHPAFRICDCGHVTSLVCGRTEIGYPLAPRGQH